MNWKIKLSAILLSAFCLSAFAANDKYIEALRNCSQFSDSGTISTEGIQAVSKKQILGWNDGFCRYRENINISGINVNISCNFSRAQIKEITSVADAYYMTLKYSQEQPDLSSIDSVKNNPITNVFNKYLQDPTVCTITGMQ